jgi:predicted phage terminase large subunit-like protein
MPLELNSLLARAPIIGPVMAERLANDFSAFARAAWATVNPGRRLIWSAAYDLLAECLTAMKARDPRYARLIVNMPPRCAKSFFASIAFPCWAWLTEPGHNFVCASYSMDLSSEHSIARRNLILSPWFRRLFSDRFTLSDDRNLTSQFSNNHRGTMFCTSTGARLLGFGFDSAIIDDATSATMALSDSERTAANVWFDSTLRSRANDPSTATIAVISQRVHELDLPGSLLQNEVGTWTHIKIPLVAETPAQYVFPSGKVWKRPEGDVLMSQRFTAKVVEELQQRRLIFSGQYQQSPCPLEGNLIKVVDLRYYGGVDPVTGALDEQLPADFDVRFVTVDCSFKNYSDSDYTAIITIGVKGRKRYVLDAVNLHLDVNAMEVAIRGQIARWGPIEAVLIEEAASGVAVLQRLKVNVTGVVGVVPRGGKMSRMMAASPEFQAGDWFFSRNASVTQLLTSQLISFPNTAHDDLVDCISQASAWLQEHQFCGSSPPFDCAPSGRMDVAGLRRYLDGTTRPGDISPETHAAVTSGAALTPEQEWEIIASTLPRGSLD